MSNFDPAPQSLLLHIRRNQIANVVARNSLKHVMIDFLPSAAQIFLPLRRWGVGREEGVRRRLHAGLLRLLAHRQTNRAQPPLHQPVARPKPVGEDGRLPGPRALHLHLRRSRHHRPAPQRERGDRHHRP